MNLNLAVDGLLLLDSFDNVAGTQIQLYRIAGRGYLVIQSLDLAEDSL